MRECYTYIDIPKNNFYDSSFFESQALIFLSKISPIYMGYRIFDLTKLYHQRPEADALQIIDGVEYLIEVKSYPVSLEKLKNIIDHYKVYGFKNFIIVAPEFEDICFTYYIGGIKIECVTFKPDLNIIQNFYKNPISNIDEKIMEELSSGKHHFRYRLAFRAKDKPNRFVNQTDKRIKSMDNLINDILKRTPKNNPPVRVYWSTSKWLSPKQLYFSSETSYFLGGPLVFDIDGPKIHCNRFPCILNNGEICKYCLEMSKLHTKKLIEFLEKSYKIDSFKIVFSGRQGFHLYVFEHNFKSKIDRIKLVNEIKQQKIIIDERTILDLKSIVGFPLSMHSYTMKPLAIVNQDKIDKFNPN